MRIFIAHFFLTRLYYSALPLLLPTTALGSTETWDNINFGVKTVFLISSSSSSSAHSSSLEAGNYWGPPLFPPWTTMFMAPSLLIFLLWCSCRVDANSPNTSIHTYFVFKYIFNFLSYAVNNLWVVYFLKILYYDIQWWIDDVPLTNIYAFKASVIKKVARFSLMIQRVEGSTLIILIFAHQS